MTRDHISHYVPTHDTACDRMSHPMVTIRHQSLSDSDVVPRIYTMYLEASNNNVSCSLLPPSIKQLQLSLHNSPPLSPLSIKVSVEYCVVYRIYYAPAQQVMSPGNAPSRQSAACG